MSEERNKRLRKLREELDEFRGEEPAAKDFSNSMNGLMEEDEPFHEEHKSKWKELRDEIDRYEAEHPEFVALLNRIATTLSDMGI
jgi:DNA replication initiation complex subunit (GINS family)